MNISKKILSLVFVAALVLSSPFAVHAAVIGSLTLNPTTVSQLQTVTISGTCGVSGANGSVSFQLAGTSIGSSVTTNASGAFSTSVTVPAAIAAGTPVLTAICPNGDTLTSNLTVIAATPIGTTLALSQTPVLGQSLTVSGTCGTSASGSTVNINLTRAIGSVVLASTTTTSTTGAFSTAFTVPTNAGGGPATITATCPTGTIFVNTAVIDPAASLSVSNTHVVRGSTLTVSGVCGTTAGGNVSFVLNNGTTQTTLGSTTTTASGAYFTQLTVPSSFPTGNATLVSFCPGGNIVTASLIVDPGTTTTPRTSGTTTVGISTTPSGGVAAGTSAPVSLLIALILLAIGSAGLIATKNTQTYTDGI